MKNTKTTQNRIKQSLLKIKDYFKADSKLIFLIFPQIITFIVFAFVFSKYNIYPFGEKSIAWCDLKQQGIPLLMNLKDVLSGGGSIFYSFNNASGMNFWGVFLFFLSNPFSFLCVFFPKEELYKLVNVFIILKLCTASFTATLFFIKSNKKLNSFIATALGVSYALCAYGLMYYQNIMWLDLMYLYPLLALAIERLAEGKGYGFYTVILSLCVIFNFYLSYMVVVAILLIIGLFLLISNHGKEDKRKISFDFFKGSALAAMISAVSWLPAFIQYGSSGRGEDVVTTLKNSAWATSKNTIFLLLLSSSIIIIGLFSLLKPNRKKIATLLSFTLFSLPIFIEPINKMWHTGSYMSFPGRYAFITVFTGLELVALALETTEPSKAFKSFLKKIPGPIKNMIYISLTVIGIFVVNHLFNNIALNFFTDNKEALSKFSHTLWADEAQLSLVFKVASIFGLTYFLSALFYKLKAIPAGIFSVFLALVVVCEGIFAVNTYMITAADRNVFNGYEEFLDLEGKIEDDDFYRIKTEKKYHDSNLLGALGYNSIGHYTSLTNEEYMNTFKALGYSSSWMELSTYGGSELSDAILGVKYKVIKKNINDGVYTNGTYSIVETLGALGLGVKYSGNGDIFSYNELNRTDFQEKIFSSLFGSEETLFVKYTPNVLNGCTIEKTKGRTIIKGKGEINYSLNVSGTQTLYFDAFGEFSNSLRQSINKGFTVYVNDKKIADYPDGMYTGFMNLGTFTDQQVNVKVVTTKNTLSMFSFGVSGLKHDVLKSAIDKAESGFLNAKDNKVWGTVEAQKGEKLFIAVPYDKGFRITLNGKKAEAEKVYGDFYSIELVEGKNVIEMKYTPPGFALGLLISIFGIACAFLLHYFSLKKKKSSPNEKGKNVTEKYKTAFPALFIALFTIVFFIIYLFPIFIKMFWK